MVNVKRRVIFGAIVFALTCGLILAGCDSSKSEKEANGASQTDNTVTVESQTIGLTGVDNARQLGGYITTDGKKIKDGVLLRSAKLSGATNEDIATLTGKYHLTEVIDLRVSAEIADNPDPVIDGVTADSVSVVDESSPRYITAATFVPTDDPVANAIALVENGTFSDTMYSSLVTDTYEINGFHDYFEKLLAHKDGAILFHCNTGKDRTGVGAVLLLSALGVDRETVMKDFALSNDYYAQKIDTMVSETKQRTNDPTIIGGVEAEFGANPAYMEKMLDTIDEKYGSMDVFLKEAIGLTDNDIIQLRAMYLE